MRGYFIHFSPSQTLVEDDLKCTKGVKQQVSVGKDIEAETVIFIEPVIDGSTPTALAFKQLEQSVREMNNYHFFWKQQKTVQQFIHLDR